MHKLAASTTIIINYTLKFDITFYCGSNGSKPFQGGQRGREGESIPLYLANFLMGPGIFFIFKKEPITSLQLRYIQVL